MAQPDSIKSGVLCFDLLRLAIPWRFLFLCLLDGLFWHLWHIHFIDWSSPVLDDCIERFWDVE